MQVILYILIIIYYCRFLYGLVMVGKNKHDLHAQKISCVIYKNNLYLNSRYGIRSKFLSK